MIGERRTWARGTAGLLLKAAMSLVAYAASLYQTTLLGTDEELEEAIAAMKRVNEDLICG